VGRHDHSSWAAGGAPGDHCGSTSEGSDARLRSRHSKGIAEPQSLNEIRLPAAEKSTSVSGLADGEMGPMQEEENELCTLTFDGVLEPPTITHGRM
jgi:hypothetical protein